MEEKKRTSRHLRIPDAILLLLAVVMAAVLVMQQIEITRQEAKIETLSKAFAGASAVNAADTDLPVSVANTTASATAEEKSSEDNPYAEVVKKVQNHAVGITIYRNVTVHSSGTSFQDEEGTDSTSEAEVGQASGVAIRSGLVLTCYHVVKETDRIEVTVPAEQENAQEEASVVSYGATVLDYNAVQDLALLSVPDLKAEELPVGDSDQLSEGDSIICISNPASSKLARSVTTGVVSGLNRTMVSTNEDGQYVKLFQTDAAINGGSSGGGIFNMNGELVGIVSRKYISTAASDTQLEGIGMCIPINEAQELLQTSGSNPAAPAQ